jgi:type IV pilus assembly protein PilY1
MKRLTALVLIAAFLSLQVHPAVFADDSDIFGANIQPNVVIMIDDSGSMGDDAPSNAYEPSDTYPLITNKCDPVTSGRWPHRTTTYSDCASATVYRSGSGSTYNTYATTVSDVNSSSARTALSTVGYWSGTIGGSTVNLFVGNYINYLYGTCASGGACSQPKMTIAKNVVNTLISNVHGVRFGAMTFYYGGSGVRGARVIAEVGSDVSTIQNAVNNLSPTSDTPLGDALYDIGRYYKGQTLTNGTTYTSPIQLACQPNFVIFITDGMQTSGSRNMPDEATNRYTQDHATSLTGTQNVIVHTVGFGVAPGETGVAYPTLQQAATNGGGQFYVSDSATQLEQALQDAIRRIVQATFTFATPVVPTTSTTGSTKAYLAAFKSDPSKPFWQGYLKAYQRDSNGLVPVDGSGVPLASSLVWEAGQVLTTIAAADRVIHTVPTVTTTTNGSTTTGTGSIGSFNTGNSSITTTSLGVSTSTERDQLINWVRGVDVYDENQNANTTEDRAWKLGDIFHATPVLVTPPLLALNDTSYQSFKSAKSTRTTVLLAAADDGMLHAFRESNGQEIWAFIPPDLLDNLKSLTVSGGDHGFLVDGSPIAADIKVGSTWKTIVVFGLRRGGDTYYALDVTDTENPTFLWSFTDSKMGETWSEPVIAKVKIGSADKYVAFVGGGYDTPQNNALGKAFFVIDLATGTKLWEYYNDGSSDDRQYMNFSIPANATAVDLNNDGYVDRVYIGDVGGQVWKFDVSATSTGSWAGKRLFAAPLASGTTNPPVTGEYYPAQAVYAPPTLALGPDYKVWVFFGTGDRNHPNATASNRFYGFKDETTMANGAALGESSLVDVTSANNTPSTGWYFRLGSNEKVLAAANVFNMNVFFSSFTPTTTVTCESGGGTAKLYSVQMLTGYAAINFSSGVALATTDASQARSSDIGSGIASMPVIVITPPGSGGGATVSTSVITATTNQQLPSNAVPAPQFLKQIRSWRERLQ